LTGITDEFVMKRYVGLLHAFAKLKAKAAIARIEIKHCDYASAIKTLEAAEREANAFFTEKHNEGGNKDGNL
jgi:hypothetical protein